MKHEDYCEVCQARKRIRDESIIYTCDRDGTGHFLWYGPVPKNEHEADKLISIFKKAFEISKAPGPKKRRLTPDEIFAAIEKFPANATLPEIAGYLKVSDRSLQRALEPFGGFQKAQDVTKSQGKDGDKRRIEKKFFKKLRRR